MEKSLPHCKLALIKSLICSGKVRSTYAAISGGAALGYDFEDMLAIVMALSPQDFYKSMMTHANHRV